MRYFTNSEMSTFRDCRRKWWLGTYRRLRPRARKVVGPAPIGTRVHQSLAQWYVPEGEERVDPREALEAIITADRADLLAGFGEDEVANGMLVKDFEGESDLVRAMIEGYVEWLAETGIDSDYRVVGSERAVEYQFADGLSIAGRIDTLLEKVSDGSHLGMDHKTGDFGALVKTLPMEEQMLLYEILRRLTTEGRSSGMLFNMLRKVKRTARAKPPFYERLPVPFNQHQLNSAWYRVMAIINDILAVTARLDSGESHLTAAYPRPNKDCSWKCEFFAVCPMFDDGSRAEDMIQSLYVVGDPLDRYPDLTGGTADE
jgi:hypothetical protein